MRVVHAFLRTPFPIFAGLWALIYVSIYVVLITLFASRSGVMMVLGWLGLAVTGMVLLARDWSIKKRDDNA